MTTFKEASDNSNKLNLLMKIKILGKEVREVFEGLSPKSRKLREMQFREQMRSEDYDDVFRR